MFDTEEHEHVVFLGTIKIIIMNSFTAIFTN